MSSGSRQNLFSGSQLSAGRTPGRRILLLGGGTLLLNALLAWVVQNKDDHDLTRLLPWLNLADKFLFDFAFFIAAVGILSLLPLFPLLPLSFVVGYLLLAISDICIYHFGHSYFERQHLEFTNDAHLAGFLGFDTYMIFAVGAASAAISLWGLRHVRNELTPARTFRWGLLALGLLVVAIPQRVCDLSMALSSRPRDDRELQRSLGYAAQNPAFNFVDEYFFHPMPEPRIEESLERHQSAIEEYGLPLGPRAYPSLGFSFDRVILLLSESMSLDMMDPYNPALPEGLTPFFGGNEVRARMMQKHATTCFPTFPGMMATFNSHPNAWMCREAGSPNSLAKVLVEKGWRAELIRADPRLFAGGDVHFPRAGFQRDWSRDDFMDAGADPRHTSEWGATDRLLFDDAIERLKKFEDKKIFIAILTIDTHPWFGRVDYAEHHHDLPSSADVIEDGGLREWLRSVHIHDYETGRFLERLRQEGLWDERTLIVMTADHSCPRNPVTDKLPGYPQTSLVRIPLGLLTPAQLPEIDRQARSCQLDTAPTILHLLDLPIPEGYWGKSLFVDRTGHPSVSAFREVVTLDYGDRREIIDLEEKLSATQPFRDLYGSILVKPLR